MAESAPTVVTDNATAHVADTAFCLGILEAKDKWDRSIAFRCSRGRTGSGLTTQQIQPY